MKTIFKYPLQTLTNQTLRIHGKPDDMPSCVMVGNDPNGSPCIWFEVFDHEDTNSEVVIYVLGTGEEIPKDYRHLGSFSSGPFVWHVYSPHARKA